MELSPLIYVVDDDISVRESVADLLATVGLEVRLFTSATEMLDVLAKTTDKSGNFQARCRLSDSIQAAFCSCWWGREMGSELSV